jgi:small nuclear ribonucleoprotein (snRNP)-like protein
MSKAENKQVIVELFNGDKVKGTLIQVDKINLKMILENVIIQRNEKEDEKLDKLEINKSDIKELKLINYEIKTEEIQCNINAIPENKIPQKEDNKEKAYDKNESFFDKLTPMTHPEVRQESKIYNQKNKDTFNLTEEQNNQGYNKKSYYYNNRGRGNKNYIRGRGGYNNNRGFHNKSRGGYNNFRGQRGKKKYNNNYYGNNNYKDFKNNNNNNNNNQNLKPYEHEGGFKPEMEKSIYDN